MRRPFLSLVCLLAFQPSLSFSAVPPPDFQFSVNFWISDECCGGGFGVNRARPEECIYVGASRPGGYGTTIAIAASPFSPPGSPANDPFLYGYGIGWKAANCTDKAFEIRTRGCYKAKDNTTSIRSFSFKLDPNMPGARKRVTGGVPAGTTATVTGAAAVDLDPRTQPSSACRSADWFEYMDMDLGRGRRVRVNGSQKVIETVAEMYKQGRFEELRQLEEYHFV